MQIYRTDWTEDERKTLAALIDVAVKAEGVKVVHVASHLLRRIEHATPVVPPEPEPEKAPPTKAKPVKAKPPKVALPAPAAKKPAPRRKKAPAE